MKELKFKAGDWVRVVNGGDRGRWDRQIGRVYKITGIQAWRDTWPYRAKHYVIEDKQFAPWVTNIPAEILSRWYDPRKKHKDKIYYRLVCRGGDVDNFLVTKQEYNDNNARGILKVLGQPIPKGIVLRNKDLIVLKDRTYRAIGDYAPW